MIKSSREKDDHTDKKKLSVSLSQRPQDRPVVKQR